MFSLHQIDTHAKLHHNKADDCSRQAGIAALPPYMPDKSAALILTG